MALVWSAVLLAVPMAIGIRRREVGTTGYVLLLLTILLTLAYAYHRLGGA